MRMLPLACIATPILAVMLDAAAIDFSKYNRGSAVKVLATEDALRATWPAGDNASGVMEISLDPGTALIRTLAIGPAGAEKTILENVDPVTILTVGSRDLTRKQGWMAFFDNPPLRPHDNFPVRFERREPRVWSEGNRVVISVGKTSAGSFVGDYRFTFYPGSPFLRAESVMTTSENGRAILYDAGLATKNPGWKSMVWIDNRDKLVEKAVSTSADAAAIAVRHRTIAAEDPDGSVAIFPAPHQYFFPLDEAENLKFTWCGNNYRDLVPGFGFGVRLAPEGDKRFVPWFNAPPGTQQHLAVFYLLSAGNGEAAIKRIASYTRNDRYKPLEGFRTFTSHYHIEHTQRLLDRQREENTGGIPENFENPDFVTTFKQRGVNIVHLGEFHFGDTPEWDMERRLRSLKTLHSECARLSDDDLLLLPGEEPNVHLGGHWISFFPKPVYWVLNRPEGEPFEQEVEGFGTVYHVGSADDVLHLMEKENGLFWTAHARIKASTGFPDEYKESEFFKSPHFFGAAWKAMPADLSRDTLGWRVLDLLSDMNNWGERKQILGEVDVFQFPPEFESYAHMNINYLQLDKLPKFEDGWATVLDALRAGKYFVTTGEVLMPSVKIGGQTAGGTAKAGPGVPIEAAIEWTFPLAFARVVSGDGEKVYRERIPLTDSREFGSETLRAEVDLTGRKWARLEVWDIAANGAFTMPVWLE